MFHRFSLLTCQALAGLAVLMLLAADVPKRDAKEEKPVTKDAKQEAVDQDNKALTGLWQVVGHEIGGRETPKRFVPRNLFFEFANGAKFRMRGKETNSDTFHEYRIDPTKNPKEIDIKELKDFEPAIYKLDGDWLIVVWGASGNKERPKEFSTKDDPGLRLFRLERVKQ